MLVQNQKGGVSKDKAESKRCLPIMERAPNVSNQTFHTRLNRSNSITAVVNDTTVQCLIDTGANLNVIDHDWFQTHCQSLVTTVETSKVAEIKVANCDNLTITGSVTLPVVIEGVSLSVCFTLVKRLCTEVILGSQFLNLNKAVIDCGSGKLHLNKKSQMRVKQRQEIPPHSQSIVCAKISNNHLVNTSGLCHGGRRISALGVLLVANTVVCVN